MNRFLIVIFCLLISAVLSGQGQEDLIRSMERQTPAWLTWYKVPGVAFAVIEDGKLIYQAPFGVSNKQTQQKLNIEDQFPMGALSELLNTYATLELIRLGKLDLEKSLNTSLRSWELESAKFETGACLVGQLLTQSSGVNAPRLDANLQTDSISRISILNGQASGGLPAQLAFKPGTRFHPSLFNGVLLDLLVDDVYGISMQEYLQRIILPELGMGKSGFLDFSADNKKLTPGHHVLKGVQLPNPALVPIAEGLHSNLGDYARFLQYFFQYLKADPTRLKLFKESRIKTDRSAQWIANHYGMGAYSELIRDSTFLYTQIGEYEGIYHCRVVMDPKAGRAILVFTNSLSGRPIVNRLVTMWSTFHYDRVPKMNRSFHTFFRLSSFLVAFLILISFVIFRYLYQTRKHRMFGFIRKSIWQTPSLLGWGALFFGFLIGGLPFLVYWVPQQLILVSLAIFIYLLALLIWILYPRMWSGVNS